MFQISRGEKVCGLNPYEDTIYEYTVTTDLNRNQLEDEVKRVMKEQHMPTRNYGEWKIATRANGAVYYSGYYTITQYGDRYVVTATIPTAE